MHITITGGGNTFFIKKKITYIISGGGYTYYYGWWWECILLWPVVRMHIIITLIYINKQLESMYY